MTITNTEADSSPVVTVEDTHTHTHTDAVIGWADVSWEYESVCMTSLLFTGIQSFLIPSPHSH